MSYASLILASSPATFHRLGDSTGTTAVDSSGHSRAGTYSGGFTLGQTGAIKNDPNTAVLLTKASSGQIVTANATWLDGITAFSFEAWVKYTSETQFDTLMYCDNGANPIFFDINGGRMRFGTFNTFVSGSVSITTGVYHHLVGTYAVGGNCTLYVDGTQDNQVGSAATIGGSHTAFCIGTFAGTQRFLDGAVDEAASYLTELSAATVLAHYNAGINGAGGGIMNGLPNVLGE